MMEFAEAIAKLAAGARIERRDDQVFLIEGKHDIGGPLYERLVRDRWLRSMPCGWVEQISDEGLKAYLRSTDEMGDGELRAPSQSTSTEES